MSGTVVESFTKGGLPAPGTPGRLVRVVDDPVQLWVDVGSRWLALSGEVADVRAYGAVGDGEADDTGAIQAALRSGANVYLPRGIYRITDSLRFLSAQTIFGAAKSFGARGSTIIVDAAVPGFRPAHDAALTRDVLIRDLTIDNTDIAAPPGSAAVDFSGVGFSRLERLSVRYHEAGMIGQDVTPSGTVGGYYNSMADCEIAGCRTGVSLLHAGNAWTVLDGRLNGNEVGIRVENSSGSRFRATFERNGIAVLFAAGAVDHVVLAGSYFEGNGRPDQWTSLPPDQLGAVRCRPGAIRNVIEAGHFSGGTDTVIDENTAAHPSAGDRHGCNTCTDPNIPGFPAMPSGHASGRNLLHNGDFTTGTVSDTVADGWAFSTATPPTYTMAIDTSPDNVPDGATAAQQWGMQAGVPNSLRSLMRTVTVTPGQWYTFTGCTKVTPGGAGLYRLRITEPADPTTREQYQYYYSGALPGHDYPTGYHRASFQIRPATTTIWLLIENMNNAPAGSPPSCTPSDECNAWFARFHLEPGRGIPTESHADGLMTTVRSGGARLPSAATIHVTHPYHTVTGNQTISHIVPPDGFNGMIALRADGTWQTAAAAPTDTTRGRILNQITLTPGALTTAWFDDATGTWSFTAPQ